MRQCSIERCTKPHNARGMCQAHYGMWRKHGDPLYADKRLHLNSMGGRRNSIQDFWLKVRKDSDCWIWTGAVDKDGYGFFWWRGNQLRAHRFVAEYILGLKIVGLEVCHRCDNPSCVNPNHLFVGTSADNRADAVGKCRHAVGEKCHTAKLQEFDVVRIRKLLIAGTNRMSIAKTYGVSKSCIDFIASGRTWKHIR